MNNYITCILLLILLFSCRKVDEVYPFENGKKIKLFMNYPQDKNGYFHVTIDSTAVNNRCNLYIEVSDLVPYYRYNGVSVIEASFDTDTPCSSGFVIQSFFFPTVFLREMRLKIVKSSIIHK